MSEYIRWDLIAMCVALAVVFVFEMLGVFTDRYVTITAIIRQNVPMQVRLPIFGWLFFHFVLSPANFKK